MDEQNEEMIFMLEMNRDSIMEEKETEYDNGDSKKEFESESEIEWILSEPQQPEMDFFAFTCSKSQYEGYFNENIKVKNVVANQPLKTGGSKCDDHCDIENHHIHFYCKACKRNLSYGKPIHDCIIGFELGKIYPDMDPRDLINEPWWNDPDELNQ